MGSQNAFLCEILEVKLCTSELLYGTSHALQFGDFIILPLAHLSTMV